MGPWEIIISIFQILISEWPLSGTVPILKIKLLLVAESKM